MLSPLSDDVRRNPFPMYEQARHASPLLHVPSADAWMIFDYDCVKRALTDHDVFSSSMETAGRRNPDWFIFFDAPRHTVTRALISHAFTPRVVAGLEPRIRELSRELLNRTIEHGEMDLAADFSIPLPLMVIAELLGAPVADRPHFRRWSDAMLKLSYTLNGGPAADDASREYADAAAEMRTYLMDVLARRRSAPREDLLSRLLQAEIDGARLTDEEILGVFQLLLLAGHETTTNLLNNAFLCLVDHPAQLARVQAAPVLLPGLIEEVLRYRSPVQWMFRATRRDVEMHGQTIPAGNLVLPVIGAANRDPAQFPDPDRFDIGRTPNPHIAFGHGVHFCLGAALSRLEARIALADLLQHLKDFALASDQPWEPRKALHVLGPSALPVRFAAAARIQ
jgi:cytochrome P450